MESSFNIQVGPEVWRSLAALPPELGLRARQLIGDLAEAQGHWPTAKPVPGLTDLLAVEADGIVVRFQVLAAQRVLRVRGVARSGARAEPEPD